MKYESATIVAEIHAHPIRQRDSLKRSRIIAAVDEKTLQPEDEQNAYFWHPIAVVTSEGTITHKDPSGQAEKTINVQDLTLAELGDLPGQLWDFWLEEIVRENPHLFATDPVTPKKN